MEEIWLNFKVTQVIEKVSIATEFWYGHEKYFEIF